MGEDCVILDVDGGTVCVQKSDIDHYICKSYMHPGLFLTLILPVVFSIYEDQCSDLVFMFLEWNTCS